MSTGYSSPSPPSAPNADSATRASTLWIVCDDTPTFHVWAPPTEPFSTGRSLCGHVTAWPEGGRYRTGRQKPRVVDAPRARRHLCVQCEVAYDEALYQEAMNHLAERLIEMARRLPTERLAYSARHAPRLLARRAARQVLRERTVAATIAARHEVHRAAGDFAQLTTEVA